MENTAFDFSLPQNHKLEFLEEFTSILDIEVAKKILETIMNYRRIPKHRRSCSGAKCVTCSSLHLSKIILAVRKKVPVTFVLPAFPGKSPNTEKVLGVLPDYAERLSLHFLGVLCEKIKRFYSPGIKIILCSDGRVFSDVVGMKESNVSAYQVELNRMIAGMSLSDISIFNLDDFYRQLSFAQMRDELMKTYGKSVDFLKHKICNGNKSTANVDEKEARQLYCGITRFLFEDSLFTGQIKSRSAIQKDAKSKAYEVIRRSNAWSDLISENFPEAVRLSIHPQACGVKKIGIKLVGNETWMTPWHGVAVETRNGYVLLKRSEAEELGAELIYDSFERPSYYKLKTEKNISLEGFSR